MNILIIGGTQFLGRHLAQEAQARGHSVTLFNRGQTAPDFLPQAAHLRGDRTGDLSALSAGQWDAVIDTCGYLPGDVARSAATLHGRVGQYVYISSVSVYASFAGPNDEDSPTGTITDPDTTVIDGRTYGPLKALCEARVRDVFGDAALLIRPGLIVGPHDPTQRFTWWPARFAAARDGAPVVVPGQRDYPVQFIDVRDAAAFTLDALAAGRQGAFNVIAPSDLWTLGDVFATCAQLAGTAPPLVWADADALEAQGIAQWTGMPLWLAPEGDYAAFMHTQVRKALAAGLHIRPLADTVQATLQWFKALPLAQQAFTKAGISREQERALLSALGATP
jgi:2'-hydroxyisoflavone reductase